MHHRNPRGAGRRRLLALAATLGVVVVSGAAIVHTTLQDFHLSGTQVFDVPANVIYTSTACIGCHGPMSGGADPYASWNTSLMAHAGRDPLFYAQMTTANQDVANVGYFCMRCHVPMSFVTGAALDVSGASLGAIDRDGVSCHFCHAMVDPIYKPGISPPEDQAILSALAAAPEFYGNAMFVLDPLGQRRGPRIDAEAPHDVLPSPFHRTGEFCGTCHDVGNVAVSRLPDGRYAYNALNTPVPSEDLHAQFPLERTYTEWKLSAFANGGVDMGGLFGGTIGPVVHTCQDCHMPRVQAQACIFGPERDDMARHDFAGASAWVLEIIGLHAENDPSVDQQALVVGRQKAVAMLQKAAGLELQQQCRQLQVRVINNTGHKLPTGHIEGRRVWINVKVFDAAGGLMLEYGHYDPQQAELDEGSTTVYEMHVGLSREAAIATGLPPGVTTHMALANTIEKDNRIPPRGFNNQAFAQAGAPVVGAVYADGQFWADRWFSMPAGAASAEVTVNYQTVTRHYIEALRDGNVTDDWGDVLYDLWLRSGKGPPIAMTTQTITLVPQRIGDATCDGAVDVRDLLLVIAHWGSAHPMSDLDGSGRVDGLDLMLVLVNWG